MGVAHFKIVQEDTGKFHWELINPRGTALFRSMGTFDSEEEATANVEHARGLISQAPIVRP